jgi:ribosomal protein S18 acetylase RimI-like enzyme
MNGVIIRPATSADALELGKLGALLVSLHHHFDAERFISPTPRTAEAYADFLAGEMRRPEALVLVAERSATIAGYAYAGIEGNDYMALRGPAGVLYDLVVDPAHRRLGIGKRLLEAAMAALLDQGAPRIVISTASKNEPAQRLFRSAGFRGTMIEMTRELSP